MVDESEVYELLNRANEDDGAVEELLSIYHSKICMMAHGSFSSATQYGIEIQDLIQEGRIGLYEAIWSYKQNTEAKFSTYFHLLCRRKMCSLVKKHNRYKHKILSDSLSLHQDLNDGCCLMDFVKDQDAVDPLETIIENERVEEILKEVESNLSKLEKDIFYLKAQGFDYIEIASILGKSVKSIDNGLHRLKKKIERFLY